MRLFIHLLREHFWAPKTYIISVISVIDIQLYSIVQPMLLEAAS